MEVCVTTTFPQGVLLYQIMMQDDVYEGYHMPKNSIIFFNEWYEHLKIGV